MERKNCKANGGVLLGLGAQWEHPHRLLLPESMFYGFKVYWSKLQLSLG